MCTYKVFYRNLTTLCGSKNYVTCSIVYSKKRHRLLQGPRYNRMLPPPLDSIPAHGVDDANKRQVFGTRALFPAPSPENIDY